MKRTDKRGDYSFYNSVYACKIKTKRKGAKSAVKRSEFAAAVPYHNADKAYPVQKHHNKIADMQKNL